MDCKFCGKHFSNPGGKSRHQSVCIKNPDPKPKPKCKYCNRDFTDLSNRNRHQKNTCSKRPPKKKIVFKVKTKSDFASSSDSEPMNSRSGSGLSNKSTINFQTITKIEDNIFDKLIENIGDLDKALSFFMTNFLNSRYIKIIEKAYLDGEPSDRYPFVCKGKFFFKFLNEDGLIVEDNNGLLIMSKMVNNIQNAALRASNIFINKYMKEENSQLLFDVRKIQTHVVDMGKTIIHNKLRKALAKRVLNPNHPYFI